jgi:hypothetical protein
MTIDIAENLGAQRLAAEKGRHRHRWTVDNPPWPVACLCGALKDAAKARRGKTSRRKGNDYERSVAARLGAKRVGQYGTTIDVGGQGDWVAIQCKVGSAFPERIWKWLDAIPKDAMHVRGVVIGDAPGTGTKRREVIVMELDDFCSWFGK